MHLAVHHVILAMNTVFTSLATTQGHNWCSVVRRLSSQTGRHITRSQPWQTFGMVPAAREWTRFDLWNSLLRCHLPGLSQHGFYRPIRREWQSTVLVPWPCLSHPHWRKWKTSIAVGLLWMQTRDRRPHLIPHHQLSFVNLLICISFFCFSLVCLLRHTQRCRNSYLW